MSGIEEGSGLMKAEKHLKVIFMRFMYFDLEFKIIFFVNRAWKKVRGLTLN